ncbi:hypothetical protein Ancab_028024 [Ancistrocladus abbreviatus]
MSTAQKTENSNSVDSALWFDSFSLLLAELENIPLSSEPPPSLVDKLKEYHPWFLDNVNLFKPPNPKSREALNSEKIKVGLHELTIKPELRDLALKLSSTVKILLNGFINGTSGLSAEKCVVVILRAEGVMVQSL